MYIALAKRKINFYEKNYTASKNRVIICFNTI